MDTIKILTDQKGDLRDNDKSKSAVYIPPHLLGPAVVPSRIFSKSKSMWGIPSGPNVKYLFLHIRKSNSQKYSIELAPRYDSYDIEEDAVVEKKCRFFEGKRLIEGLSLNEANYYLKLLTIELEKK